MNLGERNKQIGAWAKKHPVWSVTIVLFVVGFFSHAESYAIEENFKKEYLRL